MQVRRIESKSLAFARPAAPTAPYSGGGLRQLLDGQAKRL